MPDQDCTCIHEELSRYPGSKLGFVVYRLTYKDDAEWALFIKHLNVRTHQTLHKSGDEELFKHIDWSVQENPELEDADSGEVRRHFQKWIQQQNGDRNPLTPRHMACITVSQIQVDSVLQDIANATDPNASERSYVQLVSADKKERYTFVAVSCIFPRVYSLLESPGWECIDVGTEDAYNG